MLADVKHRLVYRAGNEERNGGPMSSSFLQGLSFFVLVLVIIGAIFGGFGAL